MPAEPDGYCAAYSEAAGASSPTLRRGGSGGPAPSTSYEPQSTLVTALAELRGADFVAPDDYVRLEAAARRLSKLTDDLELRADTFVHGDVHCWNLIVSDGTWWIIDFDDAGFAPAEMELATMRTHFRHSDNPEPLLSALLEGWGDHDLRRVAAVTALHTVKTVGVFPSHLDIASLARDAAGVFRRYLGFLEAELDLTKV